MARRIELQPASARIGFHAAGLQQFLHQIRQPVDLFRDAGRGGVTE
ncbi:MAG: hypothetical protein ABSF64_17510 [Bryobacteraceae bacterium]|jgi:hypothetical protein